MITVGLFISAIIVWLNSIVFACLNRAACGKHLFLFGESELFGAFHTQSDLGRRIKPCYVRLSNQV